MEITPDVFVYWQWDGVKINATLALTWLNMVLLAGGCWLVTRRLTGQDRPSRWRTLLEVLVAGMEQQIADMGLTPPREFLPFIGSLFVFVLFSNILSVVPGYLAPTGSLSTTAALALCVFLSVPLWGIRRRGFTGYLRLYVQPSVFMLPFNVMGELFRTLALAVRLFGNVMSGSMIAAILLAVTPLFFPVVLQLLGLITGVIQAYIFAVLTAVYIAAAVQLEHRREEETGG